jgi:hypothetical protein
MAALKLCDEILRKTTYEEKFFKFDFSNDLEDTDVINSAVVTATPTGTGHIVCGSSTYNGGIVQTKITSGTANTRYTVTCKITTVAGEKIEASGYLDVKAA